MVSELNSGSFLIITCMVTDRIGLHSVLLPLFIIFLEGFVEQKLHFFDNSVSLVSLLYWKVC